MQERLLLDDMKSDRIYCSVYILCCEIMQGTIDYFGLKGFIAPLCENEIEIIEFKKRNLFMYTHKEQISWIIDYTMQKRKPLQESTIYNRNGLIRRITECIDGVSNTTRPEVREVIEFARATRGKFDAGFKIDVTGTKLTLYSCPRDITAAVTLANAGSVSCKTIIEVAYQAYMYTYAMLLKCLSPTITRNVMLLCLEDLAAKAKREDNDGER